ncbi:bifunctional proline dehydrogenase/L-glutamate gamma-semialdehyde dehydrogenase PutA [Azospirillum doebereinerae]|uniref:bifunctional proline dehydrogenase/L-glutamate gamma-semialdehyde dehydrogenase PutA n=1 Tax=Azospirillum doebereinerae TaxID=92933 RepID=UPI001EE50BBB|nr:bifunctional proline dehydrogenase/L-glutamate gamma-semialdehyde dehydrogenase PutA [Azospirillum doebereinerae]MCG5243657.1 bifunctional proline dehydrogenase/L-glutamate gamma-semialdehyde dehydrogenase PutA [Azospirillum doebereinerae]
MPAHAEFPALRPDRAAITAAYRADEARVVDGLIQAASLPPEARRRVMDSAARLVEKVRETRPRFGALDAFLQEFGLSTKEGVALMCLAEALLRIPDAETADSLIRDKIGGADWTRHLGKADSLFVNASTWALMLTGKVVRLDDTDQRQPAGLLDRLVSRAGEPVIRQAMMQAMRILGRQFVMGRTIEEALDRAREPEKLGYRYSYDMLGEAARTQADADRYQETYARAIAAIGKARGTRSMLTSPGISVKLSAIHPRYEIAQQGRVMAELCPRLLDLAQKAKAAGIHLTVDAEEADRLDLSLDVIETVFADPSLDGWEGFGLAVQAYQKRALPVIDWLGNLAARVGRKLMIRLVKGAYWDSEIKRGQERGLDAYPVFTRKASTDVSYLACARKLLGRRDVFHPMFATHNAHTVASVLEMAGDRSGFEFQRLHGMGEPLYHQIVGPEMPVRVYAPVGSHEDLLAYLVRRLLENGANSSFVNRIQDEQVPVADIVADPVARIAGLSVKPHPRIPLPKDLYGAERLNSEGADLSDPTVVGPLLAGMETAFAKSWTAGPIVGGLTPEGNARSVADPSDNARRVGTVLDSGANDVERALALATAAHRAWAARPVVQRADCLTRAADLMERNRNDLLALLTREGGKVLPDAIAELREAVDFCRYYATRACADFAPMTMPGPTGERNELRLTGRGVFVCISPWNFPLAIFMGQVAAALVAGNAVIAKPAEQTPLIAAAAVRLLLEAGVPPEVLHLLPGDGATVGGRLVSDRRVAGVAFTGSTDTAHLINRTLATRGGSIVPFIAETGGQNAMLVDNSALPEQVVDDVVTSAFRSAGQRCSALRVLFVQDGIAPKVIEMLKGAAAELRVGDPALLTTDVGPVIDREALGVLRQHVEKMKREATTLFEGVLPPSCANGSFLAPHAFEIDRLDRLEREVFGPVLHVIRFKGDKLDSVLEAIETTGYGLTLGVHTRIDRTARKVAERMPVGNIYVNRNMIGAVVGVQPFGGEGLSGTGPKAGGPRYLTRFAAERTLTVNTTAAGGNTSLVSLEED